MSDELISKESLERLAAKVRDEGWLESFKHVFEEEPHLVCFTLAMSTRLCLRLEACGVPMGLLRRIEDEMMVAQLTCIESLRESYRTLWTDLLPEDPADGKADADGKSGAP